MKKTLRCLRFWGMTLVFLSMMTSILPVSHAVVRQTNPHTNLINRNVQVMRSVPTLRNSQTPLPQRRDARPISRRFDVLPGQIRNNRMTSQHQQLMNRFTSRTLQGRRMVNTGVPPRIVEYHETYLEQGRASEPNFEHESEILGTLVEEGFAIMLSADPKVFDVIQSEESYSYFIDSVLMDIVNLHMKTMMQNPEGDDLFSTIIQQVFMANLQGEEVSEEEILGAIMMNLLSEDMIAQFEEMEVQGAGEEEVERAVIESIFGSEEAADMMAEGGLTEENIMKVLSQRGSISGKEAFLHIDFESESGTINWESLIYNPHGKNILLSSRTFTLIELLDVEGKDTSQYEDRYESIHGEFFGEGNPEDYAKPMEELYDSLFEIYQDMETDVEPAQTSPTPTRPTGTRPTARPVTPVEQGTYRTDIGQDITLRTTVNTQARRDTPLTLNVSIQNDSREGVLIETIDIDEDYLNGFLVQDINTPLTDKYIIPGEWTIFEFYHTVAPRSTYDFIFTLKPVLEGTFEGMLDICLEGDDCQTQNPSTEIR